MTKVRVVMAELEGAEETVLAAVRSFLPTAGPVTMETPAAIAAAPVVDSVRIEAPAPTAKTVVKRKAAPERTKRQAPVSEPTASSEARDAILAELRKGGKTSAEVINATGLKPHIVYYWLDKLRTSGDIETVQVEGRVGKFNRVVS